MTENAAREALLNKVRNIMALAQDEKATDGERSLAAERVAKLMAKYEISLDDLRTTSEKKRSVKIVRFYLAISNAHGLGSARADALAWAAVNPFGGRILRTNPQWASMDTRMTVFIREDLRETVELLLQSLLLQMENALAQSLKDHLHWWKRDFRRDHWVDPTSSQVSSESKSFRRTFYGTWGQTVGRKVRDARKEALEEARQQAMADAFAKGMSDGETLHGISTALVLVDTTQGATEAMEAYFAERYGEGKKPKASRSRAQRNGDGDMAGWREGRKADIGLTRLGREQKAIR